MEQEQAQEGTVEEQVKEEISKPVSETVSTGEKATSESDEWKRMMQSRADKAEFKAQSLEKELQTLRKEREQQRLEARQKEIAALSDEPDEQAKVRRKHQLEDELLRLEEQKTQQEGAVQRKYDQAIELATKHNLSLADARELMKAETPREMELLAQLKLAEKARDSKPPKETKGTGFKPDSATSDAGGDDDKSFLERWNAVELPATKENLARIRKIINK